MIKKLLVLIIIILLFVALVAPFSFMKPEFKGDVKVDASKPLVSIPELLPEEIEDALHQVRLPNFAAIKNVKEKKRTFFNYLHSAIEKQNKIQLVTRSKLITLNDQVLAGEKLSSSQQSELSSLAVKYRVNAKFATMTTINSLLQRVDVIPEQLVLVQAANESAWGTSRFSRIGLNFFGIWCYQPKCGMVPNGRETGSSHEVKKFDNVNAAIAGYFHHINTGTSYQLLRKIRAELRADDKQIDSSLLAEGLIAYSARGEAYVEEIQTMIRQNQPYFSELSQNSTKKM